jgi:hypothetical protein
MRWRGITWCCAWASRESCEDEPHLRSSGIYDLIRATQPRIVDSGPGGNQQTGEPVQKACLRPKWADTILLLLLSSAL